MTKSLLRRLRLFSAAVFLVMLLLTARLAWLQIYRYEHYYARAETNRLRPLPITATRGEIFDKHGRQLAANRPGFAVSLLGLDRRNAPEVISYLSELLEMSEEDIRDRIWRQRFSSFAPIRLANDVSPEIVAKLEERRMDLPGVVIETQPVRLYPDNSLAAHLLGYVGAITQTQFQQMRERGMNYRLTDTVGQSGIEATWEQSLRGRDGVLWVETNRYGRRVRVIDKQDPVPGNNLILTLDARLQDIAERALAEVIANLQEQGNTQAGKGAIVALDPNTGGILAMVSYPAYDPNNIFKEWQELTTDSNRPLFNRAIQGGYPVGSTYKMVGAAGGLEEGLINERSIITCSGRRVFFPGERPRGCFGGVAHGSLNVVGALAKSCNIFFFELGRRLGVDNLTAYAEDFGFGSVTGLTDLSGEVAGILDSRKRRSNFRTGDVLTVAIGQGHMFTPLQLANYAAMIANGGIHYRPHLVAQIVDHNGNLVEATEPEIMRRLDYNDKTWEVIRKGMDAVTEPGGTAGSMRFLPVKVSGKTGSAQAGPDGSDIIAHSLFVGYAPAEAPEIAIAIIVEHGGLGGRAAVPVTNKIFAEYYEGSG